MTPSDSPDAASRSASLPGDYFDRVYGANDDPWGFDTSPYEAEKYATTLAALGDRRFEDAFEIGCSIGVLTAQLAPRCQRLLAVDVSDAPLASARQRCAALPQVLLQRMQVPAEFPSGSFDLVLMSEVGYYWNRTDLSRAAQAIVSALRPGGWWLLVHWTPEVHDYPLRGDEVHEQALRFADEGGPMRRLLQQRKESYRVDLLERKP
jgi:SAM-dependent methyltransferase